EVGTSSRDRRRRSAGGRTAPGGSVGEAPVKLHRYWIRFDDPHRLTHPLGLGLGCGVTAFDLDDVIGLLERDVFKGPMPFRIASSTEDMDVTTLDQGHVIPNMLPPDRRGVWYPMGYAPSLGR